MIEIAAPPAVPRGETSSMLIRLLPLVMSIATLGIIGTSLISGSPATRNPTFLAFPLLMVGSVLVTALTGRGRQRAIDHDRTDYLHYLGTLRRTITETVAVQRTSLHRAHPDPDTLWTLIGGPRMWERRSDHPDYCRVRVGIGTVPLGSRLSAPEIPPVHRSDPVTVTALQRFLGAHSTVADVPIAIPLRGAGTLTIDGDASGVRGLLRAMICQLAVLHAPDNLLIVALISDLHRTQWDWLKWLPHSRYPLCSGLAEAESAVAGSSASLVVVIVDNGQLSVSLCGATSLVVGAGSEGTPVTVRYVDDAETLVRPDMMDAVDALVCARRLAGYRFAASDDLWRSRSSNGRLCVPIGTSVTGQSVELDIKEAAEQGMGPHGLCIGATGSGKSELLRTIALGMMMRNSPAVVNLLLVDFKGGATFLDFTKVPHVAAVITNLAQEAPLVARMRDALAGEINRRQELLRSAGNFVNVATYEQARRSGAQLGPLPALFIIVDEFSELLSQHPDFADIFVAIGRQGRSLGMHLLLASQRLDEGRLRGLEAHLSYRICLKTLSASDSRSVLGTFDAYELPNTPGAGLLQTATGQVIRFQGAYLGALRRGVTRGAQAPATVQLFTEPRPTPSPALLDRLSGQGPPAHPMWLPPLGEPPALGALLADADLGRLCVPIGIVDRPFDQDRTPLVVELSGAAGNVAIVGAPRTGKSTAVRTLITALAATHDPGQVQFYCLDFGGGSLASLREMPHVGVVVGRAEPDLVWRTVAELESILRTRETSAESAVGDVFLVVDGLSSLCLEFAALEESIKTLAAQGLSFGVHVVLSASRWAELRPAMRDQIGTRIELRLGDPADSELDRKQAQQVPRDKPGRGLSHEGLHMMIALPTLGAQELCRGGGEVAPPIRLLPERVEWSSVVHQAADHRAGILLGLEESRLQPVAIEVGHCLVLGESGCGKTAALRTLCHAIVRSRAGERARLYLVDFRRSLLGVVAPQHLGGHAMSSAALTALMPSLLALLQARMPPWEVRQPVSPDVYLVVDDYDLVVNSAGNPLLGLLEYLPHAADLGLHLIVARRSGGAARALFDPLLSTLRDLGCLGLMMSAHPDEGTLLGTRRPRLLPPGRGILVRRSGAEQLIQVAWCSPP